MIIGDHRAAVCSNPLESSCFNLIRGKVNPLFELPVPGCPQLESIVSVVLTQRLLAVEHRHRSERCVQLNNNFGQFQIPSHYC